MENNSPYLAQSESKFITNTEKSVDAEAGLIVYGKRFIPLIRQFGFGMAIKSLKSRWLYTLKLVILRELSIIRVLLQNFDKIEKNTLTYHFIKFVLRSRTLTKGVFRLEKKMYYSVIANPLEYKGMINDEPDQPAKLGWS